MVNNGQKIRIQKENGILYSPNLANEDKNTEFGKGNQGNVHFHSLINTSVSKPITSNKNRTASLQKDFINMIIPSLGIKKRENISVVNTINDALPLLNLQENKAEPIQGPTRRNLLLAGAV